RPGPGGNHQGRCADGPAGMGLHRHGLVRGGVKANDLILEPGTPQLPGAFDKPLQGSTRIEIAVTASINAPDDLIDAQMRHQFTDVLWCEELDLHPSPTLPLIPLPQGLLIGGVEEHEIATLMKMGLRSPPATSH